GQVTRITGEYLAKSADGTIKILGEGSLVFEDDIIIGNKGFELDIALQNGDVLELSGNAIARLGESVTGNENFDITDTSLNTDSFFAGIDKGLFYLENFDEHTTAKIDPEIYSPSSFAERIGLETDIWAEIAPHKAGISPEQLQGDLVESDSLTILNMAPSLRIDSMLTMNEDIEGKIIFSVSDSAGVVRVTASAEYGSVTVNSDNTITYVPQVNFNGEDTLTVTATDDDGATTVHTSNIMVNAINDTVTQIIESDTAENVIQENSISGSYTGVTLNATDADGQTITYSLPDNIPFRVDTDGKVYVTQSLDYESQSSYTFTATAMSEDGTTSALPITINVTDIDDLAPTAMIVMGDAALKIGEMTDVIITFSEAVIGFDHTDLSVENGTLSGLNSDDGGITWRGTFTPASDIEDTTNLITLSSSYTDMVGNTGLVAKSADYSIDTITPMVSITSLSSGHIIIAPEKANGINIQGLTQNVEAGSLVTVQFGNYSDTAVVQDDGSWTLAVSANDIPTNGSYVISADVNDMAENNATQATQSISVDDTIFSASFIDAPVGGLEYSTSSGLSGFTNADGTFIYRPEDSITFKIGNLVIGEMNGTEVVGADVFLQDVAAVDLGDLNNNYVENMAILFQQLDADSDASNGITITADTRTLFADTSESSISAINFETTDKVELSDMLVSKGINAFTFEIEKEAVLSGQQTLEDRSMLHVKDTIEDRLELKERQLSGFSDRRIEDVNDASRDHALGYFVESDGSLTITREALLNGIEGIQVKNENLKIDNLSIDPSLGTITDNGNGTYSIVSNNTFNPENPIPVTYTVWDWTSSKTYVENFTAMDAPTVTITADSDADGFVNAQEGVALPTTLTVTIGIPSGAIAGQIIEISDGNSSKSVILAPSDIALGSLSVVYPAPIENEALNITATIIDNAGNKLQANDSVTLDMVGFLAPTLMISNDINNDGFLDNSEISSALNIKIGLPENAVEGDKVLFTANGGVVQTFVLSALDIAAQVVHIDIPNQEGEGVFNVSALLVDRAGNVSVSGNESLVIDTVVSVSNDAVESFEDTAVLTGNVLKNDDSDAVVESIGTIQGTYGEVTLNADGNYTYVLDTSAVQSLTTSQSVSESFAYTVRDSLGNMKTATLTLGIQGTNDAPTLSVESTKTVDEDGSTTITYSAGDIDGTV
ncbi:Ig-like domain-containing protein, partial [Sulfuricurvum sp.]|uniref:Ig-like domain-containing protein n=1 Tax=Sulfuricurvum sp. TaxID=2025608 RepID=UPI003BB7AEA8